MLISKWPTCQLYDTLVVFSGMQQLDRFGLETADRDIMERRIAWSGPAFIYSSTLHG